MKQTRETLSRQILSRLKKYEAGRRTTYQSGRINIKQAETYQAGRRNIEQTGNISSRPETYRADRKHIEQTGNISNRPETYRADQKCIEQTGNISSRPETYRADRKHIDQAPLEQDEVMRVCGRASLLSIRRVVVYGWTHNGRLITYLLTIMSE
jgi:hypothetical protein